MGAAVVRTCAEQDHTRQPGEQVVPVLAPLVPLFPHGGLTRGAVTSVDTGGYLAVALLAGASGSGSWTAVVGLPEFGTRAAAGMGADLDRVLLIDEPGDKWAEATAALLDAVDLVLLRPAARPSGAVVRRLTTLARQQRRALVVIGDWEGAPLRLRVASRQWLGLGDGHGHLRGCRVQVVAEGRGGATRPRVVRLWLPTPDGRVADADILPDRLTDTPSAPPESAAAS